MKFDPYEKESLHQLLGDEGVRILNDSSFHPDRRLGKKADDPSTFKDSELLHSLRGCFIGAALAWADIQYMIDHADKLLSELAGRHLSSDRASGDAAAPMTPLRVPRTYHESRKIRTPEQRAATSEKLKAVWIRRKAAQP